MNANSVLRLHTQDDLSLSEERAMTSGVRKLAIFSRGALVSELLLDKAAFSIGRDPHGDVLLMDPQISRLHLKLTRISSNYLIEDCSTNGTLLNGRPVHKHVFRPGDSLQVGSFVLRYVMAKEKPEPAANSDHAVTPGRRQGLPKGRISFLQGPEAGQSKALNEPLFTIGNPGEDVAVISRRNHGLYLLHIGGEMPKINGVEMKRSRASLKQGDVIDVGERRARVTIS